jgi:hypothetical protein
VSYLTLSIDGLLDQERRAVIDDVVRRQGGTTVWRSSERAGRTYALLELPEEFDGSEIRAACGETVYEEPLIALALFPALAEALPALLEALGGRGRPTGILACRPCRGGVILEWDPTVSSVELVIGVVDVELRRFASGRTADLLSPLPPALVAGIAADGLQAPQITPERILELRINRA